MSERVLHMLFSAAAAGTLRQAVARSGRPDEVIGLPDNLSFGPIDSLDSDERMQWLVESCRLAPDEWDWLPVDTRAFWSRAALPATRRVVWMTRNSAREFAGFLACMHRFASEAFTIVDGTYHRVRVQQGSDPGVDSLMGFGELGIERMQSLLDSEQPLDPAMAAAYSDRWAELRSERALLRVVAGEGIASVPIGFFDRSLLAASAAEWRRAIRIVATTMFSRVNGRLHAVDDMLLCSRILVLIESGRLETRETVAGWSGDRVMREAHLRLPAC
jgi:hypothetical protein